LYPLLLNPEIILLRNRQQDECICWKSRASPNGSL